MKPPKQHGNVKFLEWENVWKKNNNRKGAKKYLK